MFFLTVSHKQLCVLAGVLPTHLSSPGGQGCDRWGIS